MKTPLECTSLDDVRTEIDRIDNEVVKLLGERLQYVKEVVKYRNVNEKNVADKERYNLVIKQRGQWAVNQGLDAVVFEDIYRKLLDYYIEEQAKFAKKN